MNILVLNTFGSQRDTDTFYAEDVREALAELGNVDYLKYERTEEGYEELKRRIVGKEVMFTGWGVPKLGADFYEAAKDLKIIAHTGGTVADIWINSTWNQEKGYVKITGAPTINNMDIAAGKLIDTTGVTGAAVQMVGGILGLLIMLALSVVHADYLVTPENLLLYELIWMIPGFLITEWTRSL